MESTSNPTVCHRYFVTVDAETEVLAEGIGAVNALRERVENETGMRIPIVWFIRFQRIWNEYIDNFNMVPHQLGWTAQDERQASLLRSAYETMLLKMVRECRESGGSFSTYKQAFA